MGGGAGTENIGSELVDKGVCVKSEHFVFGMKDGGARWRREGYDSWNVGGLSSRQKEKRNPVYNSKVMHCGGLKCSLWMSFDLYPSVVQIRNIHGGPLRSGAHVKGELRVGKEVKGGPCTAFSGDPGEGCSSGGLENLSRDHKGLLQFRWHQI